MHMVLPATSSLCFSNPYKVQLPPIFSEIELLFCLEIPLIFLSSRMGEKKIFNDYFNKNNSTIGILDIVLEFTSLVYYSYINRVYYLKNNFYVNFIFI